MLVQLLRKVENHQALKPVARLVFEVLQVEQEIVVHIAWINLNLLNHQQLFLILEYKLLPVTSIKAHKECMIR